jgi:hypothetical protein
MRRLAFLFLMMFSFGLAALPAQPAVVSAQMAPAIAVSPASGDHNQIFTFAGQGFNAGTRLTVYIGERLLWNRGHPDQAGLPARWRRESALWEPGLLAWRP